MNNMLATLLCLASNNVQSFALAFPIQRYANMKHPHPLKTYSKHHPPFISSRGAKRRIISMSSGDTSDDTSEINPKLSNNNTNDDVLFPRPSSSQQQQHQQHSSSEYIYDSSTIDWEPIDIDEMDDFFDTIELDYPGDEYVDISIDDDELLQEFDKETLLEILGLEDDGETITIPDDGDDDLHFESQKKFDEWDRYISDQVINSQKQREEVEPTTMQTSTQTGISDEGMGNLERALLGGVVPAEAGVGSGMLPGDEGFDPLELSTKDYFKQIQNFILGLVPERKVHDDEQSDDAEKTAGAAMPTVGFVGEEERPPALILRDYREAEIRHGRLAMLAAVIWPLQEIFDRIFIPDSFGSTTVIYGGPTLPYLPLIMTFFMLNLGYLDIYSSEIKEKESGDAFLPGECFWDPLCFLEGAPDSMKRNMQEREISNGRAAMVAVAGYIFEEAMTHKPIVSLPTNALLFEPAYQVPFIQEWLDMQFGQFDYIGPSELQLYIDIGLFT